MSHTDADMETKGHQTQVENAYDVDEKARYADMKADAVEAENAEHRLGVISAVKGYPMAATWAFVFSCTIVSRLIPIVSFRSLLTPKSRFSRLTAFSSWATSSPYPLLPTDSVFIVRKIRNMSLRLPGNQLFRWAVQLVPSLVSLSLAL
jgi:hypothetical protein